MDPKGYDAWFLDIIAYYRKLDFFVTGPFAGLTNEACQQLIEHPHPGWFADRYAAERTDRRGLRFLESLILSHDKDRVWAKDQEGVYGESKFYLNGLIALSRISRDHFNPTNPTEKWLDTEDEFRPVIHVTFGMNGTHQQLWIKRDSDFASPWFLAVISDMAGKGTCRFRQFGDDQDWLVTYQSDHDCGAMDRRGFLEQRPGSNVGVLAYPHLVSIESPRHEDGWLFVERGKARYTTGDTAGAYEDWRIAHELGVRDVYEQLGRMGRMYGQLRNE